MLPASETDFRCGCCCSTTIFSGYAPSMTAISASASPCLCFRSDALGVRSGFLGLFALTVQHIVGSLGCCAGRPEYLVLILLQRFQP